MNPYSHAPFIVGVLFILLSIGSFYTRSRIFTIFSSLSLCSGFWQLSWAIMFNTTSMQHANLIAKLGHIPIISLPISIIIVAKNYYYSDAKISLRIHVGILIFLSTLVLFTDKIINGVTKHSYGYYPNAGSFHFIFMIYASYATIELLRIFRDRKIRRPEFKTPDYIFLLGLLLYPLSAVDFLVNYGFDFYPFGFIFLVFFIAFTFSAILLSLNTELNLLNSELESRINTATEKINRQQSEILQSSKLASIGVMAAGVAHELNNPINFLKPTIQKLINVCEGLVQIREIYVVKNQLDPSALEIENSIKFEKFLKDKNFIFETSINLINKIQSISSGLNTFTRQTSNAEKKTESISEIIDTTINLIPDELTKSKEIEIKIIVNSNFELFCNANQLSQVILNLVKNAIDAIDSGGLINITIDKNGKSGIVQIQDNGPGISKETIDKIFDPFFTTKAPGKGTGLGLSISREIITAHAGLLQVESETGRGTKFTILFTL